MTKKKQHETDAKAGKPRQDSTATRKQTSGFTYCFNGHDGTFDLIGILNPRGQVIARLYYWDEPDTNEAARVKRSARTICKHLNKWQIADDPIVTDLGGGVSLIAC